MQQLIKADTRKVTTQLRNCRDFNRLITLIQNHNKDLIKNAKVVNATEIVIAYNQFINEIECITKNSSSSNEIDTTDLVLTVNRLLKSINRFNNY